MGLLGLLACFVHGGEAPPGPDPELCATPAPLRTPVSVAEGRDVAGRNVAGVSVPAAPIAPVLLVLVSTDPMVQPPIFTMGSDGRVAPNLVARPTPGRTNPLRDGDIVVPLALVDAPWTAELSWRITEADPYRVNTLWLTVDALSAEEREALLTSRLSPIVEAGYLRWSTPAEVAAAFEKWEADCLPTSSGGQ